MTTICLVCGESFSDISYHMHYNEHMRIVNAGIKKEKYKPPEYRNPPTCHACGMELNKHLMPLRQKEQPKMTREEAVKKACVGEDGNSIVTALHNLGLLKFDEEKNIDMLFEFTPDNCNWTKDWRNPGNKYGTIRLEEWPEGLVLWAGGEIKWKSWEKYYKKGDAVSVATLDGGAAGIIQ